MSKAFLTSTALLLAIGIGSAQAASTQNNQNQSTSASSTEQSSSQNSGSMNIRQELQNTLSKQGYTDISVMPSSFMVHAKDKKGEPVAMVVGPDLIVSVTEVAPNKQADAATDQSKNNTKQQ